MLATGIFPSSPSLADHRVSHAEPTHSLLVLVRIDSYSARDRPPSASLTIGRCLALSAQRALLVGGCNTHNVLLSGTFSGNSVHELFPLTIQMESLSGDGIHDRKAQRSGRRGARAQRFSRSLKQICRDM